MTRQEAKLIAEEVAKIMKEQPNMQEQMMSIKELAEFLRVSRRWVEIHMDEFPYVRMGKRVLFPKSKVLETIMV